MVAARIGSTDVAEDRAAAELAALMAGGSIEVAPAFTGRANLHATARGLLVVDRERVDRFNRIDEAVTLATLPEHAVVDPRQMVATVKIIPFAIPAALLERCRAALGDGPLLGWRRSGRGAPG